jgi:hypothetical protein
MQIVYTKHALDKMALLSIRKEQIIKAIKQGSMYKQTDGFLAVCGYLCVAFKSRGQIYKIKTVYLR